MHRVFTRETPFSLTYGTEAVPFLEAALPSPCIDNINLSINEEQLQGNLDLLEEAREASLIWIAMY